MSVLGSLCILRDSFASPMSRMKVFAISAFSMSVVSCSQPLPTPTEVAGIYAYRLSNGEIEVLTLSKDMEFRHTLFSDQSAFEAGSTTALLDEHGRWSLTRYGISLDISRIFQDDFASGQRLPKPEMTSYSDGSFGYWRQLDSGKYTDIVRNEATEYQMVRVKTPEDLKKCYWDYK